MAAINRAAIREQMWPGIIKIFGLEYQDYEPQWTSCFNKRTSSKAYEEYVQDSAFGLAPVKAEGAPVMFDEAGNVWKGRVEMNAYALGFVVTREAVNDDQYFDLVPRYTKALKRSMIHTEETRAGTFMDGLFSIQKTGDGSFVCATNHPLRNGATLSNAAAAHADLNEASLEAMLIQMGGWMDERGLLINVQAERLVVPNSQQFVAERLMKTVGARVGTSDNDVAAVHTLGMIPGGYRVNRYLSDPDAFFLITNVSEGLTYWEREALDIEEGDGSETQTMKVLAYQRYAFSCMDPRGVMGMPG
jgi:hypothetical protein